MAQEGEVTLFFYKQCRYEHKQRIVLFLTKYLRGGYSIHGLFLVDKKGFKVRGKYDGLSRLVINVPQSLF